MEIHMLVVRGKQKGKHLRFPAGEFVFGRGPECHVRPESPLVSRQHCLLRVNAEGVFVRDLGSTNGTLVNGARLLTERCLQPNDELQVGPLVLRFTPPLASAVARYENPPADTSSTDEYPVEHQGDHD
jgi:pSer/pThr/pTyr-binding forkhead associated (FHA) protein